MHEAHGYVYLQKQIRDQALAFSGISEKMFGPSVIHINRGIWASPYGGANWQKNGDDDQYRRALYTYWKRTSPYPSMITFDAAPREVCSQGAYEPILLYRHLHYNDSAYMESLKTFAIAMKGESRQ